MGFRIEAPKQDGNARFNTLKVNLNENNSATRVVVVDDQGNFYYGAGGAGSGGSNGTSGTSGAAGAPGTSGTSGANGTSGVNGSSGSSGTSGTGFNAIADPLQGRVLLSDGSTNNASASLNLFYDTGSSTFEITGSISSTQGFTGSLQGTSSWAIDAVSASYAPNIYNSDGILTGNRVVDGSFYFLRFNSYVGIDIDPIYKLDVNSTVRFGTVVVNSNGQNRSITTWYGANSVGANIFIGGGGYSSIGEVGQTFKGSNNITLGVNSLLSNTTGYNNTSVGNNSLVFNSVGNHNSAFGYFALRLNTSGSFNTALGFESLYSNTTGNSNVAIGVDSMYRNTTGGNNTAVGLSSLYNNTTGTSNSAFGNSALFQNIIGTSNTAVGNQALLSNTSGSNNVGVGANAGQFNTTGNSNIFIGTNSGPTSPSSESNRTWIGNDNTVSTWLGGSLLIGTKNNSIYSADIFGSLRVTSSVLFPGLTQVSQNNVVLIDTTTGQLYYTASSGLVPSTAATASFVSSSNVYGPYGFNSIQTASYALTASSADDFLVRGTLTAQTIVAQVITSSTEYVTGSTIFGSELSNTHQFTGSVFVTGSLLVNDSAVVLTNQTGSMSVATSSYAFTASYVDATNVNGLFRIATGSVSASVNVTPESLFLINSGFTQYFNISSSGDTDIYSNLFIIRNFTTKEPVLTVSQSIIQIATQSFDPVGITQAGTIWFTSASMYVGLE